jgi:hypothetical protein
MAIGRSVDIAINHDENAVAMHTTNHPGTLHYCESVFDESAGCYRRYASGAGMV